MRFTATRPAPAPTAFAKAMANTDKLVRDKAVKNLRKYLSSQQNGAVSILDLLKVWKALFYCFWMSDKAPVQQMLAASLADLVHCFQDADLSTLFLRAFFQTMVREWGGIDR